MGINRAAPTGRGSGDRARRSMRDFLTAGARKSAMKREHRLAPLRSISGFTFQKNQSRLFVCVGVSKNSKNLGGENKVRGHRFALTRR